MTQHDIEPLVYQIRQKYGYDFSGYAKSSLTRRMNRYMSLNRIENPDDLMKTLLDNEIVFSQFVEEITVNVTEMFRDPLFYKSLKNNVFPELKTYPHIRIWDAGCSTGEEVYSLAILLFEQGLKDKSRIYATDINQKVLATAAEGIFNIQDMAKNTQNYHQSGGLLSFSNYYHAKYNRVILDDHLRKNIIFSIHNLATDGSFNEFNMILCRNVMIYFDKYLKEKVFKLFFESLSVFGYLALGNKESLSISKYSEHFEIVDSNQKIYRKIKE